MLLATVLCYVGFCALCLSMNRHYGELTGNRLAASRGKTLRIAGWAALALSFWAALESASVGMALVNWCAALMGSAVLLVFIMPYWPRLALSLAGVGVLLAPVAAFIQLLA